MKNILLECFFQTSATYNKTVLVNVFQVFIDSNLKHCGFFFVVVFFLTGEKMSRIFSDKSKCRVVDMLNANFTTQYTEHVILFYLAA